MLRREFLKASASLAFTGVAGIFPVKDAGASANPSAGASGGIYFIPGYAPKSAYFQGRPITEHPRFTRSLPRNHGKSITLVTRVDPVRGSVRRALMPVFGHEITIAPDGGEAFFNSMNGAHMLTFDPRTLEIGVTARPEKSDGIGGGHAVYSEDGRVLFVGERAPWSAYRGDVKSHFGRVVLREPKTLKILGSYSAHGIAPHEIKLLDDGKHIVIANYGRTSWPKGKSAIPEVVEPSLTILERETGKLVHKIVSPNAAFELRHVAARRLDRIFAIQGRIAPFGEIQKVMTKWAVVYEPDRWSVGDGYGYLPAPVLRYVRDKKSYQPQAISTADVNLMRYGQSIIYDATFDEVIGTFPSRHAVIAFDGASGRIKKIIDTGRLGLQQPRGIVLHPDAKHYAVSGYWQNIYLFRRGSHAINRKACVYETFFGHSHMSVA